MLATFTLGRVLILFAAMADYIMLTSPFGGDPGSDELAKKRDARSKSTANPGGRTIGKDDFGAAELLVSHKIAHPAMKRMTLAQLSPADQALMRESGLV